MGHGERYKRLGLIIVLFMLILFLYGAQYIFTGDGGKYESQSSISTNSMPDKAPGILDGLFAVLGFVGFLFGGLVLSAPEFPVYLSVFIYPLYFIVLISFWYMIIDWIMDAYDTFVPL